MLMLMLMLGLGVATAFAVVALSRKRRHSSSTPMPATPAASPTPRHPDWRAARSESLTLEQAVAEMTHHAALLQQLADAWLTSANQWTTAPAIFRANVDRASSMARAIEDEALKTVDTLRHLERLRDGAARFDQARDQAHALADQADTAVALMRDRLGALASVQGLDAAQLQRQAKTVAHRVDAPAVEQRLAAHTSLESWTLSEMLG
jgi:hypothetical protein